MTVQQILKDIETQLANLRNQYRDLDVQRSRLEGREVILLEIQEKLKEVDK